MKIYVEIDTEKPDFWPFFRQAVLDMVPKINVRQESDEVDLPCPTSYTAADTIAALRAQRLTCNAYTMLLKAAKMVSQQRGVAWDQRERLENILLKHDLPDSWYQAVFSSEFVRKPILLSDKQAARDGW